VRSIYQSLGILGKINSSEQTSIRSAGTRPRSRSVRTARRRHSGKQHTRLVTQARIQNQYVVARMRLSDLRRCERQLGLAKFCNLANAVTCASRPDLTGNLTGLRHPRADGNCGKYVLANPISTDYDS
jgi:hypothetical protein